MFEFRPYYRYGVLIGGWNEDRYLQEEKTRLILEKLHHHAAFTQRTRKMLQNLCREVNLQNEYKFVMYDSLVQIKAPDVPNAPGSNEYGLYLSGLVNESQLQRGMTHPSKRFDVMNAIVPANQKVLIKHVNSGQMLAIEFSCWYVTFFGSECRVALHTYKDLHRMETAENMWMIDTEIPKDRQVEFKKLTR